MMDMGKSKELKNETSLHLPMVRALPALLLIIFLSGIAFSADYPAGVKQYGYYMVPQGAGFSIENFTFQGNTAYAIVSGSEVYAFFLPRPPLFMPDPIIDNATTLAALRAYYTSVGMNESVMSDYSAVHEGLQSLRTSHYEGESKCRVLLGTDRGNCTDFESCLQSCYSVTSFCMVVALGAGKDFVNTAWDFENDSGDLKTAYDNENASYAILAGNVSKRGIEQYLSSVEDLYSSAIDAASSDLFYGYSYCFQPDYSLENLTLLRASAYKSWKRIQPFYELQNTSNRILNRTHDGITRKRMYEFNKTISDLSAQKRIAEQRAAELNRTLAEQSFIPRVYICLSLALPISIFGALAYVLIKKRKERI